MIGEALERLMNDLTMAHGDQVGVVEVTLRPEVWTRFASEIIVYNDKPPTSHRIGQRETIRMHTYSGELIVHRAELFAEKLHDSGSKPSESPKDGEKLGSSSPVLNVGLKGLNIRLDLPDSILGKVSTLDVILK